MGATAFQLLEGRPLTGKHLISCSLVSKPKTESSPWFSEPSLVLVAQSEKKASTIHN